MRICLISREYPPETGYGGIATFSYHLAHGLKELGHDVEVVCLSETKSRMVEDDGIKVHRVVPFAVPGDLASVAMCMPYSRSLLKAVSALWQKFIELHQEKPFDVVDTPELLAEGIFPAVTKTAPLVIRLYTPHSKFMAEQLHNITANFDHQFVAMLERIAMLSADAITSPSDNLADFVADDLNYSRDKIEIIRNPIDPNVFSPDGEEALPPVEDGLRVLFIGRLEERKGINYLVQAIPAILSECPNTEFVIIGADTLNAEGGQRSVLNDLKEYLARHQVLSKVKFIPRVPLTDLPKYYRSADVSVVPSVYDNSPYTCLEAMSCGRAVVGTNAGGTKEYMVDGESGLIVPSRDSESLREAIVSLLQNPKLRSRLGEAARRRVLDKFQRQQIALETLALYQHARTNFAGKTQSLYLRPEDQALSDAAVMLYSFDKMIYDLLYKQSLRFRLRHWWRQLADRPKLTVARALLRFAHAVTGRRGSASQPALVRWLEQQVTQRQQDTVAQAGEQRSNQQH